MISVPCGTGDLSCGYDIRFADDIRFAYEGNGYYIIFASQIYHTATPYIISRERYIIETQGKNNIITTRGELMLFHFFNSQEERRNFGGSAFIEVQFCKLPVGTKLKKIVSLSSIKNWQNDSLYIDDADLFYTEYQHIFDCGIYDNLNKGVVDTFGINYYAPNLLDSIIERLNNDKPTDYLTLKEWLIKSKEYNGVYILGI